MLYIKYANTSIFTSYPKILDGVISPILLYNSEVWGAYIDDDFTKWDKSSTEKTHLKYCKLYLGVNRKASNFGSRGELGRFPYHHN
jgi:hypothetical protein